MAAVRVMAQRIARARRSGLAAAAQQYGRVIGTSEGDDAVLRVGTRAAGMEKAMAVVEEEQQQGARNWRRWSSGSWIAAGAASLSFAASTMTVAYGKERVTDRFSPKEVVLYQYDACPFCNKVKAFLDYHDIAYKVVEVNPVGKKEIKWSDYKKVPILVVDGEALNDSTAIITELTRRIQGGNAKDLAQKIGSDEEEKWRSWVDEHLVHLLSPNIYRTPREALQAFDYLTTNGNFSSIERATGKYVGATAMYFIGKRLKKRHNIIDARASLYEAAEEWVAALNGRSFMGGSKPNLADLAVFGVLRPIRHLDTGKDLLASTQIGEWYMRMEDAVGETARLPEEPLMGTIDSSMKV
ncbi:uncharacterized protein [Physcomitrium patens]|uniref:Prostaglandin E synthase 2 n=1 Tax=Physcomitrium patens TaxID=3218 RepID=A0A2K1INH1_PHYPA|nr:prostaglandin E synthase 2-like [Physcomitrium patens]PNR30808.1 hypothetical protein PHYPA_027124 [Physcomitrium patens]|eukprot:XP_024360069.1 prostaglandin E synthase 2-like [Physcomitrella patens]